MNSAEVRLHWLALARLFFARPHLALKLIKATSSVEEIFGLTHERIASVIGNAEGAARDLTDFDDWEMCRRDLELCDRLGIRIICFIDDDYPPLLRMISDAPIVLFLRGMVSALSERPCVAMVGARKASSGGMMIARKVARDLAEKGITVVSGMAFGIDAAAHHGALDASGTTVAVWGTGADVVYPRTNRKLADRIVESGAVVTEFPPGTGPVPYNFPQRNRIISGLSLGTVVVEAAAKSGSLITARYALDQGREVYSLPGEAASVFCRGSNKLIKDGAILVEDAQDIVNSLFDNGIDGSKIKKTGQVKRVSVTDQRQMEMGVVEEKIDDEKKDDPLLKIIAEEDSISLDDLIEKSGLNAPEVLDRITRLQMDGVIEELPGRRYTRC